ncbi:APC family permease [Actinoplanes utahensis]|uniref:APC family permease n=1 Tax=Actinoplanes utahensis TaxID=1869 RepID=UPI00068BC525|nr:APC family permease [Actinoplanes utahensis]GIF30485.1 hypothetical protein Aut01nite_34710 [Actinoplanes utahensis]
MSQPERKLGTWPVFVIAVSAMTPLTVVAGALPLGYGSVGEKGIPVAYMLVAAVLGVFAVGLAAMARHVPNSGAFYAYASIGISRPVGVGTAFVALLAYNAMQIGLYGAFGVAAHNALAIFGINVSWIVLALIGWAVIAALGRLDIDLNARILTVLVCAEVLIVLLFDIVMVGNPAGGTVTFDTLNPALIASAGGVSLLVAAIAGMVGFEAPLVYAAEARDPRRTVARAIGFTLLVAAVLYGGTAWAMSVVAGPDQIVVIAGQHLDDLFFYLPAPYLWTAVVDLGRIFFATSLFAAMLAFHHTVARYGLTVAREGVLPQALARTRRGVPVAASSAQSALALVVLLIFAAAAWNPTKDLFFFGTVSGGLGVLILMAIASVAVVRFFGRSDHGETLWRRRIAPWIANVFLWLVLLLTIAFFGELLDSENVVKIWSPTLLYLLVLIAGLVWGRKLRRQRPEVYAVIGTGRPPLAPDETPPPDRPAAREMGTEARESGEGGEPPGSTEITELRGTAETAELPGSAEGGEPRGSTEIAKPRGSAEGGEVRRPAGGGVDEPAFAGPGPQSDALDPVSEVGAEADGVGRGAAAAKGDSQPTASGREPAETAAAPATAESESPEMSRGTVSGQVAAGRETAGTADRTQAEQSPGTPAPETAGRSVPAPRKSAPRKRSTPSTRKTMPGGGAEAGGDSLSGSAGVGERPASGTGRRTPSPRKRTSGGQGGEAATGSRGGADGPGDPVESPEPAAENRTAGTGRATGPRVPRARRAPEDEAAAPRAPRRTPGAKSEPAPPHGAAEQTPDPEGGPVDESR